MRRFLLSLALTGTLGAALVTSSAITASAQSAASNIAVNTPSKSGDKQDIPRIITYQGVLRNADGSAVKDGEYTVTMRIYGDENGVKEVWRDTYNVQVKDGIFNLALGSGSTQLPEASSMDQALWLSMQVGNESEMRPFSAMTATAYALNVPNKSISADKISADYVKSITLNGQTVTGNGSEINIQTGDGMVASVDPATNSILLKAGMPSLNGAKGGSVEGNTTITGSLTVTGSTFLGTNGSTPVTVYSLSASRPTKTNASKQLMSGAIDLASVGVTPPSSTTGDVTGTLPATNGGTGLSTFTLGDMLYANTSTSLTTLAGNTSTTMNFLTQTGDGSISAAPAWTDASGLFILNQNALTQTANFDIDGDGAIGGTLYTNSIDENGGGNIAIGSDIDMDGNTITDGSGFGLNLDGQGDGIIMNDDVAMDGHTLYGDGPSGPSDLTIGSHMDLDGYNIYSAEDVAANSFTGGSFDGTTGDFSGDVTAANVDVGVGDVSAGTFTGGSFDGTTGDFSGDVTAANVDVGVGDVSAGTFTGGSFDGTTGDFSGDVTAANVDVGVGDVSAGSFTGGSGSFTTLDASSTTSLNGDVNLGSDGTDDINFNGTAGTALDMGTHLINNVVDPVSAQDAATKNYVDNAVSGTTNTMAKFTTSNTVGNSLLTDDGSNLVYNNNFTVSNAGAVSGATNITSAYGASRTWQVGSAPPTSAVDGDQLTIIAGAGVDDGAGSDQNGGDLYLNGGAAANAGTPGTVFINSAGTDGAVVIGNANHDLSLYGQDVTINGATFSSLTGTATFTSDINFTENNQGGRSLFVDLATSGNAGDQLSIVAGDGNDAGGGEVGGNLVLSSGAGDGDSDGNLLLKTGGTTQISVSGTTGLTTVNNGLTVDNGMTVTGATMINTGSGDGQTDIGNPGDILNLTGSTINIQDSPPDMVNINTNLSTGETHINDGANTNDVSIGNTTGVTTLGKLNTGTAGVVHSSSAGAISNSLVVNGDLTTGDYDAITGIGTQAQTLSMGTNAINNVGNITFSDNPATIGFVAAAAQGNVLTIQTQDGTGASNSGGPMELYLGRGGDADVSDGGGNGGDFMGESGDGGAASATQPAGNGGEFQIEGGGGGSGSAAQLGGNGGDIIIDGGSAGPSGGFGAGNFGNVLIQTGSGNTSVGNGSGTFTLNSSNIDISNTGAISGATTIGASGTVSLSATGTATPAIAFTGAVPFVNIGDNHILTFQDVNSGAMLMTLEDETNLGELTISGDLYVQGGDVIAGGSSTAGNLHVSDGFGDYAHIVNSSSNTYTYTIPNAGSNTSFIVGTSTGGQTIGGGLTVNGGLSLGTPLSVANGGTGQSSALTQYGVIYASTSTAMASTAAGTTTTLLHGNAAGAPTFGQVVTADITDLNVTPAKISNIGDTKIIIGDGTGAAAFALSGDVTMTNAGVVTIANDAVTTAKIADLNVTPAKISNIGDTKIIIGDGTGAAAFALSGDVTMTNAGVVTISADAVSGSEIADGTITNADISVSAAIAYSKLALTNSIVSADIAANTIVDADLASGDFNNITGIGAQAQTLNMNSHLISNVTDPAGAQDAATKNYVDNLVAGAVDYDATAPQASITNGAHNLFNVAYGATTVDQAGAYITADATVGTTVFDVSATGLTISATADGAGQTATALSLSSVGDGGAAAFDIQGGGWSVDNSGAIGAQSLSLGTALSVANGGTGATSLTQYGVVVGNGTSAVNVTAAGAANTVLRGTGASDPTFGAIDNNYLSSGDYNAITGIGAQAQTLNMNSHLISNVTDPAGAQDAATKNYVDGGFIQFNPASTQNSTSSNPMYDLTKIVGGTARGGVISSTSTAGDAVAMELTSVAGGSRAYGLQVSASGGSLFNRALDVPTGDVNIAGLTASRPVVSDASKNLTSALINLANTTDFVTGTLAVGNGGTGATSLTQYGVVVGNGTSAVNVTAAGAANTVLRGTGASDPTFGAIDNNYLSSGDYNAITGIGTQAQALAMGTNAIGGVTNLTLNGTISGGTTISSSGTISTSGGNLSAVGGGVIVGTDAVTDGYIQFHGSDAGTVNTVTLSMDPGVEYSTADRLIYLPDADGVVALTNSTVASFSAGSTGLTPNTGTTGDVTLAGTLDVDNGGTGATSLTQYGVVVGNGTSAVNVTAAGAANTVLRGTGASDPTFGAIDNNYLSSGDYNAITGIGTQAQALAMGTNAIGGVTNLTLNGTISGGTTISSSGTISTSGGNLSAVGGGVIVGTDAVTDGYIQFHGSDAGTVNTVTLSMDPGVEYSTADRLIYLPDADGVVALTNSTVASFSAGSTGLTPNTGTTGDVTLAGTLDVDNGGTGATSLTQYGVVVGNGTSAVNVTAAGAANTVLRGTGASDPTFGAIDNNYLSSGDYNAITGIGTQAQALAMGTNAIGGVTNLTLNGTISGGTTISSSGTISTSGGNLSAVGGGVIVGTDAVTDGYIQFHGSDAGTVNTVTLSMDPGVEYSTADRLIYLPDADGVVALTNSTVASFSAGSTGLTPNTGTTGDVTLAGTLDVDNGGTGATSLTQYGVVVGNGTSAVNVTAAGAANTVLRGTGASDPTFGAIDNNYLSSGDYNAITGIGTQAQTLDMNTNAISGATTIGANGAITTTGAASAFGATTSARQLQINGVADATSAEAVTDAKFDLYTVGDISASGILKTTGDIVTGGNFVTGTTTRISSAGAGTLTSLDVADGGITNPGTISNSGDIAINPGAGNDLTSNGNLQLNGAGAVAHAALSLKGDNTNGGHIQSQQTTAPTAAEDGTNNPTGSISLTNATDVAGHIALVTDGFAAGVQATVTFNKTYATAPIVIFSPADAAAATALNTNQVFITSTATTFSIGYGVGTATSININYHVIETQ